MASFDPDFSKLYDRIHSLASQWNKREVSLATPLVSTDSNSTVLRNIRNPRDKTYALLSLTSDPNRRDRLRVDYFPVDWGSVLGYDMLLPSTRFQAFR